MCHQSVGLIARAVEAAGIPTLVLTSALSITQSVGVPRAAFVDFPLGHTAGPAQQPQVQRDILSSSLELFTRFKKPGQVEHLPFVWSEIDGDAWKDKLSMPKPGDAEADAEDERTERDDTPQYQNAEDEQLAAQSACDSCIWLS